MAAKSSKSYHQLFHFIVIIFITPVIFTGCRNGKSRSLVTISEEPREKATGDIVGFEDVKPIFEQKCSFCHGSDVQLPPASPLNALDYESIVLRARGGENSLLYKVVVLNEQSGATGPMPKSGSLSDEQIELVSDWILGGAPEFGSSNEENEDGDAKEEDNSNAEEELPEQPQPPGDLTESEWASVQKCLGCHGKNGMAQGELYPHLAGLNSNYIETRLTEFSKPDNKTIMGSIASGLDEDEKAFLAEYFSEFKREFEPRDYTEEELKLIEKVGASENRCTSCHTESDSPIGPDLKGQSKTYLKSQLMAFSNGDRANPMMSGIANTLSDQEKDEFAEYFSLIGGGMQAPPEKAKEEIE